MIRTVSAIAVVDLANELMTRGLITETDLNNISRDVYSEYKRFIKGESIIERRLEEGHLLSLWCRIENDSRFAFDIGSTVNKKAKGLLANWISYSESLAQSILIFLPKTLVY